MNETTFFFVQALEIVWINILLSGDNAVVIALACRSLPEDRRTLGIALGAGVAVLLRIVFSLVVADLSQIPFLRLAGGIMLIWIAVQLVVDDHGKHKVKASMSVWGAVRTVALADAIMSLDNVIAIAMAAKNDTVLIIFGLVVSIPLVVFGSSLVLRVLERLPMLVWAGAAMLGWIAGDIISDDPVVVNWFGGRAESFDLWAPLIFTAVALSCTWAVVRFKKGTHHAA